MKNSRVLFLIPFVAVAAVVSGQSPPVREASPVVLALTPDAPGALRDWDSHMDRMVRDGSLSLRSVRADTLLEDHRHERFDQHVAGVRVFGGDISRQVRGGVTESIFGHIYQDIGVDVRPRLSEDDARAAFGTLAGTDLPPDHSLELVILPLDAGGYALAWRGHVWTDQGWMHTFVDAHSGAVVLQYNDLQTQSAVGTGTGVLGDRKKISTHLVAGRYVADDQHRPPLLVTYDARGNLARAKSWLFFGVTPGLGAILFT